MSIDICQEDNLSVKYEDLQAYDPDDLGGYCSMSSERAESPVQSGRNSETSNRPVDEKRIRREIANSNERRRMQSINAGFNALRSLLPHHEGEKLSKATILQQTADYVFMLEKERTALLTQNCHLKRLLGQSEDEQELTEAQLTTNFCTTTTTTTTGYGKRRKTDTSQVDDDLDTQDVNELRIQLDRERALRMHLEEKVQNWESMYPDKLEEMAERVNLQYHRGDQMIQTTQIMDEGVIIESFDESLTSPSSTNPANTTTILVTHLGDDERERDVKPTIISDPAHLATLRITEAEMSPHIILKQEIVPDSVYRASKSRQNLETIVEAIRHLEGDSLFDEHIGASPYISDGKGYYEDSAPAALSTATTVNGDTIIVDEESQDAPLALTKHNSERVLQVEMNSFLQFHAPSSKNCTSKRSSDDGN